MMRRVSACLALCASLAMADAGQAATRSYIVTDFDSVRLEAPIAVTIQTRRATTARAEGNADLLERIDLSVSGHILTIRLKKSPFEGKRGENEGAAKLFLSAPSLRRAHVFGAGALTLDGLSGQNEEISVAGTGTLDASGVDGDTLFVAEQGAGSLKLAGKAKKAIFQLSGAGSVDATGLAVADLEATADGAGTLKSSASRSAKITATGATTVTITGQPACTVHHAGSGAISCAGRDY